jgi:hypothetical protein
MGVVKCDMVASPVSAQRREQAAPLQYRYVVNAEARVSGELSQSKDLNRHKCPHPRGGDDGRLGSKFPSTADPMGLGEITSVQHMRGDSAQNNLIASLMRLTCRQMETGP